MIWRALLIGCGKIGSELADDPLIQGIYTHAGAYHAHPETQLVAVCDRDPERAERCARRWNVPVWGSDPQRLLRETAPDLVSVCTPDDNHAELLLAALDVPAVKAILAEKPLAVELAQARRIHALARDKDVLLAVNYSRRYSPAFASLKQEIAAGAIGKVQAVTGNYCKGTLHNGSHWFDLARYLIGEVTTVQAWNSLGEEGDDPTLDVRLVFSGGGHAYLQALDSRAYTSFEMDIAGSEGRVRIVELGHRIEVFKVIDSPFYSGYRTLLMREERIGGMQNSTFNALDDLVGCLNTGQAPRCSSADGVAAIAIGMVARASVLSGRPETVDAP